MTPVASSHPERPLTAIAYKIGSVAIFVAMFTLIKAAGPVPAGEAVFFRSLFAMPPILIFLAMRGDLPGALKTSRPFSHFARGFVGVCSMALRWSAVVVGLLGVCVIAWPKLTLFSGDGAFSGDEALGVMATLCAAAASALAMILVRSLVHTEKTGTIVFWFSFSATTLSLLTIPFGWEALSFNQAALLISAGMCGGIAQLLMTEAYRHAEASVVAPFEYTSMILSIAVGYFLFHDVPTIHMLVGGAIVVGAGIFIILRERQLGIQRAAARKATPPQ
jgi:drug/metabolite transporter (DMT)-like permease